MKTKDQKQTESNFSVFALTRLNRDDSMYVHWSEGLEIHIDKDGVSMVLTEVEIQQLVKCLPRIMGGSY